ncbi:uncharacterized protein A1O9_09625 [Exophiala aquamarina CBS 119918]|uniref:Dynamin GTPase n=1 Tax=Exophiala aquamarina CBS 119918 TaxID=1182545 RepID=A0A072P595_9EURO|nr:uncharacterized protein A1O9_09625 [Exophiala aquamarina CBS 119918]KEF54458.1 hypothetical protein A1O9_09625 [Exophiala aquamarina CBS 119918]
MPAAISPFSATSMQKSPSSDETELSQPEVLLQTPQQDELIDVVDALRSQGITHYIDLPQLIVCGDQSSGKSSVLEAISGGLRFPTKDSLCTRFAIELVLRRSPTSLVNITIIPDEERPMAEKEALARFQPPTTSMGAFPEIIDAAAKEMGIDGNQKSFSKDVLRVELYGPKQPHLTLVDLPGIYHAESKNQSRQGKQITHLLVQSYMKKKRSIILAVVSAMNDYNLQVVTEYAQSADPGGDRTLGIITKPDTLHSGSSTLNRFQSLVIDQGTFFKLGWHVLRNRDFKTRNHTTEERDEAEEIFFQTDDWKQISKDRLGVHSLRKRLGDVLFAHILQEFPQLLRDVQNGITKCEKRLKDLGASRDTLEAQRNYLFQASQTFTTLMQASVDGTYHAAFFGTSNTEEGYKKRLRAVVQNTLKAFAQEMHLRGHAVTIVDQLPEKVEPRNTVPTPVAREEFLKFVEHRMSVNRGRELPGTFNPDIIGDLFRDQAQPWKGIMKYAREQLLESTETTIDLILKHVADATTAKAIQLYLIQPKMNTVSNSLAEKVDEVLRPHLHGTPLTFNKDLIEHIQRKRREEIYKVLAEKLVAFFGKDPEAELDADRIYEGRFNVRALLDTLALKTEVDFDRFACVEATNAMEAYYKVALKTVIDSFGAYAVEASLLGNLETVFNPKEINSLDDETIAKIASESVDTIAERGGLEKQLSILKDSLQTLQTLQREKTRRVPETAPQLVAVDKERSRPIVLDMEDTLARAKRSTSNVSQDSGIALGSA